MEIAMDATCMLLFRAALLVALLLASIGTASAECAWVLWERLSPDQWAIVAAAPDGRECERTRKETIAYIKANDPWKRQFALDVLYRCLPDTIDPRGPKTR
jgi:hypothetical protein